MGYPAIENLDILITILQPATIQMQMHACLYATYLADIVIETYKHVRICYKSIIVICSLSIKKDIASTY